MIEGCGLPLHVPDDFLKTFLAWKETISFLAVGEEVKEKAKTLSFYELMRVLGPKWMPTRYPELYGFTVHELAQRKLTLEQRRLVREAWHRSAKSYWSRNPGNHYEIINPSERSSLWRLLGNDNSTL